LSLTRRFASFTLNAPVTKKNQETEGLLSPTIRSVRLRNAAALIPSNSVVVDLASGAGFLREFLPPHCRYFGVDRIPPPDLSRFDAFYSGELTAPDVFQKLESWLPEKADVITLLAFVEHVKDPASILKDLRRILKESGKVVLTTPHPIGRKLHDSLARLYLCSRSGAAEHESFFDRNDLGKIAHQAGYVVVSYRRFLFGLNQLMEITPAIAGSR
jgi:SAM-dependent methyltransferase